MIVFRLELIVLEENEMGYMFKIYEMLIGLILMIEIC